jgi:hypothetical protein
MELMVVAAHQGGRLGEFTVRTGDFMPGTSRPGEPGKFRAPGERGERFASADNLGLLLQLLLPPPAEGMLLAAACKAAAAAAAAAGGGNDSRGILLGLTGATLLPAPVLALAVAVPLALLLLFPAAPTAAAAGTPGSSPGHGVSLSPELLRALALLLLPLLGLLAPLLLLLLLPLQLLLNPPAAWLSLPTTLVLLFQGGRSVAGDLGDSAKAGAAAAAGLALLLLLPLLTDLRIGLAGSLLRG